MFTTTVTIANGQTTSSTAQLAAVLCAIVMPAAFTGTTLSFQVSFDGVTFQPLYKTDGTLYSLTVAAGRTYAVPPADFTAFPAVQIVSGANEGAARTITLLSRVV